jgi:hypothetical protein
MSKIADMEERKLVNDTLIVAHSRKHHGSIGYTIRDNDDVIMIKRGLNKEFLKNDIEILTLHDSKGYYSEYQPMEIWDDIHGFTEAIRSHWTRRLIS